ncbi:MAG: glycosyl hydrolase family 88 [Gemmatimonadetes bacterium]|nr:glycosyl hydrolase family 88 [Gemmatimonadota bacterium]
MAAAVVWRHPVVHAEWDYTAGLVLLAIEQVGRRTGEARFLDYVRRNVEDVVGPDGTIRTYDLAEFNLDQGNEGKVLSPLLERTGDPRYRRAAELLRTQLRQQPRTSEGGFWHKQVYPRQMWLDGSYMAAPFLAQYAATFGEDTAFADVARQILLVGRHTRDPVSGLYYHGWDESRTQAWADSRTGTSASFWGRAVGWYAMSLVDVLDFLPETHPQRAEIVTELRRLAAAVTAVQDPATGLWWDVLDQPGRKGNYREASASSMFVYALAKGVRQGHLDGRYRQAAERGHAGLVRHLITSGADGLPSLTGIVSVSGLGGKQNRSGTFEYYVSEPVVADDYKGVGAFILASLELGR